MKVGKIDKLLQIFSDGKGSEPVPAEPVAAVKKVAFDMQETAHQAEADAARFCAEFKHQRRLLELILDGKSRNIG